MRCSLSFLVPAAAVLACLASAAQTPDFNNVGRAPSEQEIRAWDISVGPEGKELPPGSGTAQQGEKIYSQKCAGCHGKTGTEGQTAPRLIGGQGTLTTTAPMKTIGSFWPYSTTIWEYINRAMPWKGGEGSLRPDEVYALTAFLLYKNGIIQETTVIDAKSLPKIQMPNRNGFVPLNPVWNPREKRPFGYYPGNSR
jgi:S-disulfanyl-L-cysteine oxidoreductase SoxD